MPHLALTLELTGLDPSVAEETFFAAGALAVTLTDAADDAILEPLPGEERLWPRTVLQALFDAEHAQPALLLMDLAGQLGVPPTQLAMKVVADRAWEREWLKDFHAMRFGRRLWIVPHHESPPADPEAAIVRLDPGLAFGTGTHPSTALCLEWLDAHLAGGGTVIDYGCGSGVLAIAAAKLGARDVACYDLDPQAGIATCDNAEANHVAGTVRMVEAPAALPDGANVLLANIISGTLCALAPDFARMLGPGAKLVLAGILDEQAEEIMATFARWFVLAPWKHRDGWVAFAGTKRP